MIYFRLANKIIKFDILYKYTVCLKSLSAERKVIQRAHTFKVINIDVDITAVPLSVAL